MSNMTKKEDPDNDGGLMFDEMFWHPARDRAAQALTNAARAVAGLWACVEGVPSEKYHTNFEKVVCGLADALYGSLLLRTATARPALPSVSTSQPCATWEGKPGAAERVHEAFQLAIVSLRAACSD